MKILYAIQATGNGHISRAMEILPLLKKHGEIDVFLSGSNSSLNLDTKITYRSKGLSLFYNCNGGLDYVKVLRGIEFSRIRREIDALPVEKYDLIINDFEYITSMACNKKQVPSVHFGHQASFVSDKVPRPENKNIVGEWILKNYAKSTNNLGLHFQPYDEFILPAIVKSEILLATPQDKKHITVYLPSLCEKELEQIFGQFKKFRFEIFCSQTKEIYCSQNLQFFPVHKSTFSNSFIHCSAIITGAGFETPAEALHLGKKLMCIPIKGQYEQKCNAAALKKLNVTCVIDIQNNFKEQFYTWMESNNTIQIDYSKSLFQSMDYLFNKAMQS